MTSFKVLIVEDEILIADNIKRYLNKKGHQVIGIAISYEEAKELYLQYQPDISILDIKLSGKKTGIDFAHFIQQQETPKPFLFLTSQVDAVNINQAKATFPMGYLSKPIQKESLYAMIEIIMHKFSSKEETIPTISLSDGTNSYIVPVKDILYLQADHIYLKVHLINQKSIIQRSSLKDFLKQLPNEEFIQTHRSFAVNIQQVSRWDNQHVYIKNNLIPISRNRRKIVHQHLSSN